MAYLNGMDFEPLPGVTYKHDYGVKLLEFEEIFNRTKNSATQREWLREVFRTDLWAIVHFVLGMKNANHPFVIEACAAVQDGPPTRTLDIWARDHLKTSIITVAETIFDIIRNPEERIAIFSHKKDVALAFLRLVKETLEGSAILKWCYPEIFYENPGSEAQKWGEESGLYVKRKGVYKEPTVSAWGLVEGMPTGYHFTKHIYDDVETADLVETPDMTDKVKSKYELSHAILTDGGRFRAVGTTFSHLGLMVHLQSIKDVNGNPLMHVRKYEATVDGSPNGPARFLSEERLAELRATMSRYNFNSQYLLDPSEKGSLLLVAEFLKEVEPEDIPKRIFKFMTIDPAGERRSDKRQGDSWAMGVIGVVPYLDDIGASDLYLLDMIVEPMTEAEALDNVVKMYTRNGKIISLGVEKVGMTTAEVHVANALRSKGRNLTVENGGLVVLRPAGRKKQLRIEQSLAWPLNNSKIHVSRGIPAAYRERLKLEMKKFPYWHDDALDMLAYVYDIIKDWRFGKFKAESDAEKEWDRKQQYLAREHRGWMVV